MRLNVLDFDPWIYSYSSNSLSTFVIALRCVHLRKQVCPKVIWEEGRVVALSHTYAVNSPVVTMARPKFAPKSTPFRGPIHKLHYLSHPWTRPTYDAKRHPDPIRRFSTMHWTDRPTDRPRESLMTIGRCAPRATRPNNNNKPAPCAVCYVSGWSTVLMVPARTQCPNGWTAEYAGYLVSEDHSLRKRTSYI